MNPTPEATETDTDYVINRYGRRVPKSLIHPVEALRDDLVKQMVSDAKTLQDTIKTFKHQALADIDAFLTLSAERYDIKWGGQKGNLSLTSYDGNCKIMLAINDKLSFDEQLHIAKQMIDACIHKWVADSDDKIKVLVEHAFQTDKLGNINTKRIFELMRLKIDDDDWNNAMNVLEAAIVPESSKQYLRIYERKDDNEKYQQISLDIAGL